MNYFITVLGSGAALPTGSRHCAAQAIHIHSSRLLLDCAEGTQDRIRQHHIKLQAFETILISHLHGDHLFGLPGLLSTMHLCGRTEPITVVAPKGGHESIETLLRLTGNHIDYPINWVELNFAEGEQRVIDHPRYEVTAFPLDHTVPTYGFRISERPMNQQYARTYAYCCDTAYNEAILPHIAGVDLLCIECTFANEMADIATQRKHLTAGQAGRLASLAGVGQLLLTHISARYREPDVLLEQASAEFENCLIATDGMRMEIPRQGEKPVQQIAVD